ncbi:MAG: efflux RND transporter periplasmic adaptor subunit [Pseudomonadales bacterium]|nr:efflux RND transporter periplasmic adaptor subunit [Pseudomonadales bacterium]
MSIGLEENGQQPGGASFGGLVVLIIGIALAILLWVTRPVAVPEAPQEEIRPEVLFSLAEPETVTLQVETQGTVQPRHQIDIVAQVGGEIIAVSPWFADGGFFSKDDVLVQIEPADYEIAVVQARSRVAEAKQLLATEKGRARQAKREWRDLGNEEANALFLRKPQVASAEAALRAAEASLEQAQLNLERTRIKAPFDGRIRSTQVDRGQFVAPGTPVARIYSSDKVEIRLPLTNRQLRLVELPYGWSHDSAIPAPVVTLNATLGNRQFEWQGTLVRTDASIDVASRVVYAVAEVSDPFMLTEDLTRVPLSIGLFVNAKITGRSIDQVLTLPRDALYDNHYIYRLDQDNRLQRVDVEILQANPDHVLVRSDIQRGDRLVVSHVQYASEGLEVTPLPDTRQSAHEADSL